MKFVNRETQFPGRKKITEIQGHNVPLEEGQIIAYIEKDEGAVYVNGTPVNAENLNKGNWRDDESLSFKQRNNNNTVPPKEGETQIVTYANGKTFVIAPTGPKEIGDAGSVVNVNGVKTNVNFTSDPQTQINNKADIAVVNGKASTSHAATHRGGTDPIGIGNGTVAGLSTNDYDMTDKNKVNKVPADTNTALANKVSSVSQAWKIYGTNGSSQQAVYDMSDSPVQTTIARRVSGGRIKTGDPTDNDDAANKHYVDTKSPRMGRYNTLLRTNFTPVNETTYTETISSLPDTGPFGLLVSFWGETVTNANHAQFEVWSDMINNHHVIVASTNNGFTFGGSAFIIMDNKKFYWRIIKSGSQSLKNLSLRAHWAMKIGGEF